ncbi:MAG TPA: hypothetical protein VFF69_03795 [Phycisphaerales bacterium]|nr:hypothetical protein [Phycisphaerales bacterium]
MAGRGGAGVGVVVTISILSILCLGLFVSTIIFYGNLNKAEGELATARQGLSEYINTQERQDPRVTKIADEARAAKKTVVGYLSDSLSQAIKTINGNSRGTYAEAMERLDGEQLPGIAEATGWAGQGEAPSVASLVQAGSFDQLLTQTDTYIGSLKGQIASARKAQEVAQADLKNLQDLMAQRDAQHAATLAAVNEELGRYRAEVEAYRSGTEQHQQDMESRVGRIQTESQARESELLDRITTLEEENQRQQNQLEVLRGERKKDLFQGQPEESLVDGRVVAADAAEGTATIDLGRRAKIRVGMTFAVYEEASAIRPNEAGEYPEPKASLEVIRIDENSAICRVLRERSGNPVVRGDVIANAVYDPSKKYKFLVVGNFDANRDGIATEDERRGIVAMIEDWGGTVTEELTGDVDFLVMGQRPALPPEPPINAPIPVVEQYVQAQQVIERYNRLFQQAGSTSIPVLNESRLRTLIGGF